MGSNGLTNIQKRIINTMLSFESINEYDITDILVAFEYVLKNNNTVIIAELINTYSDIINNGIHDYLYENNDIVEELYYLVDTMKMIKNKTKKGTSERIIIRDELKELKNLCSVFKNSYSVIEDEDETYFKIISYLLLDESNYDNLEELLKRRNKLCNLRYNDKHIVISILELYVENLYKMFSDKNGDYINPTYLKNVYYLFTKNPCCHLNQEEKIEISKKLNEVQQYVNDSLKSKKRRKKARKELNSLSPKKYYKNNMIFEQRDYTDDYLLHLSMEIKNLLPYVIKENEYEEVFLCHNKPYKIEVNEDNTVKLSLYAINYELLITENSKIQEYFEYLEFTKTKMDDFFHDGLNPKLDQIYPAIIYDLTFFPSGKIKSLNLRQTNIKVTEDNKTFKDTENMNLLKDLYKKSVVKNGGTYSSYDLELWNRHFEDVLESMYVEFLNEQKLPFIYYGYSKIDDTLVEKNMNSLNSYFSSLSKTDSYEIANILSSNTDRFHYSVLPIEDPIYELRLLDPISFLGIENQRMLNNLYFNCRKYENMDRLHSLKLSTLYKYIDTVDELNNNINYVGITQKFSRGKIKNLVRI